MDNKITILLELGPITLDAKPTITLTETPDNRGVHSICHKLHYQASLKLIQHPNSNKIYYLNFLKNTVYHYRHVQDNFIG